MNKYFINAMDDTFISNKNPQANYSKENYLLVKGLNSARSCDRYVAISLLKFDLNKVSFDNMKSAYLYVYIEDYYSNFNGEKWIFVNEIKTDYNYKTVNWNTRPDMMPTGSKINLNKKNEYIKIDVSEILNKCSRCEEYMCGIALMSRDDVKIVISSSRDCKKPYIEIEKECIPIIDCSNKGSFTKKVDKEFAQVNDIITYEVNIANLSDIAVENAVLKDAIPIETRFIENSVKINDQIVMGANPQNSGISLGVIKPCSRIKVSFQAIITELPKINELNNIATIDYSYRVNQKLIYKTGKTNSVTTEVNQAKVLINKIVDKNTATMGDTLEYTIVLNNTGNTAAKSIVFYDELNRNLQYIYNSLEVNGNTIMGANPTNSGGVKVGCLEENKVMTITFKASLNTIPTSSIQNFALVYYNYTMNPKCCNDGFGAITSNIVTTSITK